MEQPDLAQDLKRMAAEDLAVRQRLLDAGELFGDYHAEMRLVHARNGERLTAILDELGEWPGRRLVGGEGSEAALLIALHDIANPTLMRRCLQLYRVAAENAEADPGGLAYLEDRVRAFEGKLQRYGTQLGWNDDGEFGAWPPVEEPDNVDERRATLGLEALADALRDRAKQRPARREAEKVLEERSRMDDFATETGWRAQEDGTER